MRYEKAKDLRDKNFKGFFGVKKETFQAMCEVDKEAFESGKQRQKIRFIGRRASFTTLKLLAGISDACFI